MYVENKYRNIIMDVYIILWNTTSKFDRLYENEIRKNIYRMTLKTINNQKQYFSVIGHLIL